MLLLYAVGFWLAKEFSFYYLVNIAGFIYLMFIAPLNIIFSLEWKFKNFLDYLLVCLIIFFTIIAPFWFFINIIFHTSFSQKNILLVNILLFIIYLITMPFRKKTISTKKNNKGTWTISIFNTRKTILRHWPLFLVLLLYGIIHFINYHFYIFMPEWDGYTNLINIKEAIHSNTLTNTYRGFFTVAIILISNFAKIDLYPIFTFWFIALQTAQILVLYQFVKIYNIKNKIHRLIILSTALAIPVINMETDMTRPQNVLLILMPIYIYYIYLAIKENRPVYWIITSLISVLGLNYHEFFIFILFIQLFILIKISFHRLWLNANSSKNKIIFVLSIIIFILLFLLANNYTHIVKSIYARLMLILSQIKQINHWRWWFLNDYAGDNSGQQVGWPGIFGAIKYYSYYISPSVLFLVSSIILLAKKEKTIFKDALLRIVTPLMFLLFVYAEILPRLNYFFLPERVLIIIVLLLLPLSIIIYKTIQKYYSTKVLKLFLSFLLFLNLIGIFGSIYIAWQKKSLTSPNEFIASQWVKNNTPENSFFITQAASAVTIKYFANRPVIKTPLDFFNGRAQIIPESPQELLSPIQQINNHFKLLQKQLQTTVIRNDADIDNAILTLSSAKKNINTIEKYIGKTKYSTNPSIYAFYSMDKFKGFYAQREWWLKTNYYGAKIENLTKKYPLVYNKDGIYIWKIK